MKRLLHLLALGAVLLGSSTLAENSDNLSFYPQSSALPGRGGDVDLLPGGMVLPTHDTYDCPDNLTRRYHHCAGARPLSDGSFYEGRFADDRPDGVGRLREADGTTYLGEFHKGRRHGFGRLFDRDGNELYGGHWRDGQPDDPQGNYARRDGLTNIIKALQTELNRNGCSAGAVDGIVGPKTRNATTSALDARPELLILGDPFGNIADMVRLWQALKNAGSGACV